MKTPAALPARPGALVRLLAALPFAALVAAAADAVLARRAAPHRPVEARLLLEAWALWGALALLALPAAWVGLRLAERGGRGDRPGGFARAGAILLALAAFPVAAHEALDATSVLGRGEHALASPWPWLAVLGYAAAVGAGAWVAARLLARLPALAAAAAVLAVALPVGLWLPRPETPPPVAAADAGGRPNLLLLVWDTCRADATAPYGYARETTPNLARLAQEALVFESARSATIFTFTSHLTMLTGVMPSRHGARLLRSRYDPRLADTLPQVLREHGYRTGGFVGTDVLAGRTGIRHGFEVYSDRVDPRVCDTFAWRMVHDLQALAAPHVPALRNNGLPHWIQDFQRPAPEVLAEARAWIENGDPRPWFCMVNLYDVHWPYLPAEREREELVGPYDGVMDGYLFRSDRYPPGYEPTDEDRRHVRDLYDAEVLQLDREVDRFLGAIDLADTAVLLTADHGEAFGEAGTWKHEHIYEPQLSVPFLLRLPDGSRSGRVPGWVSGVDVAPTLLGVAGLPPREGLEGIDLSRETPAPDRLIRVEDTDNVDPRSVRLAVFRGHWKMVREGPPGDRRYRLFDLRSDPIGAVDVSERHPDVARGLIAEMEAIWSAWDERLAREADDLRLGSGAAGLRALGYLGDDDEERPEPPRTDG